MWRPSSAEGAAGSAAAAGAATGAGGAAAGGGAAGAATTCGIVGSVTCSGGASAEARGPPLRKLKRKSPRSNSISSNCLSATNAINSLISCRLRNSVKSVVLFLLFLGWGDWAARGFAEAVFFIMGTRRGILVGSRRLLSKGAQVSKAKASTVSLPNRLRLHSWLEKNLPWLFCTRLS